MYGNFLVEFNVYPIFIVIPENIAGKICFMTEICIYVDMLLIVKLANLMTMFSDLFMCIFFFKGHYVGM